MAERHTHQAIAATNYALAQRFESQGGDPLCWVPTLIFYTVVHVLDARLADANIHVRSQGDRLAQCRAYSSNVTGPAGYKNLQTRSEEWRYEGKVPTEGQIGQAWRWAEAVAVALGEPWPPG